MTELSPPVPRVPARIVLASMAVRIGRTYLARAKAMAGRQGADHAETTKKPGAGDWSAPG